MGYKKDDPCIGKAFDDERLFVLMTRDPFAPQTVVEWIKLSLTTQPPEKLHEALDCAIEMSKRQAEFVDIKNKCTTCNGSGEVEVGTLCNSVKARCEECRGSGKKK